MNNKYVNIVFNLPIDEYFSYSVPDELRFDIQCGLRVLVPFGKRNLTGIITQLTDNLELTGKEYSIKPILKILDTEPIISEEMIKFCQWISEYYFCPIGEAIFSAIPKTILIESKIIYTLNDEYIKNFKDLKDDPKGTPRLRGNDYKITVTQGNIIKILKDKALTLKQIEKKLNIGNLRASLIKLQNMNVIKSEHITSKEKVKPKKEKYISFDLLEEFLGYTKTMLENFAKETKIKSEKQIYVLNYLIKNKVSIIKFNDLLKNTSSTSSTINSLIKKELLREEYRETIRQAETEFGEDIKIKELNDDQKQVLIEIHDSISKNQFKPFLLFGVTGSGKTQVYIEVINEIINNNKTAIILVPEISLTPQLIHRFKTYFGEIIGVVHSKISEGERFDVFRRILSNEVKIVIGARSALFAPLKNLGVIIVDEEHDHSYKQTEKDPKYNARDSAIVRAKLNNAVVILGSATPSIESYFNATTGKYSLLKLPKRALQTKPPKVEVINMRDELLSTSKYIKKETIDTKFLSSALLSEMGIALKKNQSIILLQNRRGYSAYLECLDCGSVKKCKNCDITLIYHKYKEHLRCHYCGYYEKLSETCYYCGSPRVILRGTGTEKVEEEIHRLFPSARIKRMDADTVRRRDSYRKILKSFHEKEFDILIGTQMISKGLDFPNVYLVGVISADVGLFNPDFRSPEKTFQLLMQVSGRSGRHSDFGKVIIQTLHPENYIFPIVQKHDYESFYDKEIKSRSNFYYPPYSRMTLIEVKDKIAKNANTTASRIYLFLNNNFKSEYIEIMRPAPAILYRLKNFYRYHIIIKSIKYSRNKKVINPVTTTQIIKNLKKYLSGSDIEKKRLISIEADPISFY